MTRRRRVNLLALLALALAGCNTGNEDRALFVPPPAMERTLGARRREGGGRVAGRGLVAPIPQQ